MKKSSSSSSSSNDEQNQQGIIWSAVVRNDTILAEAGEDQSQDQSVIHIAQQLLKKEPTPGYEYYKKGFGAKLRGIKFHVYDQKVNEPLLIWSFCAVYDSSILTDLVQVKSFLEKMVYLTDHWREYDEEWRLGDVLAVQESFAPILYQRMQEVTYLGKMAMVHDQVDSCKEIMHNNINMILENDEKIKDLDERAGHLQDLSKQFQKRTQKVKRFKMMQNAKHGLVVGTAVTGVVAAVTIPPLIALL